MKVCMIKTADFFVTCRLNMEFQKISTGSDKGIIEEVLLEEVNKGAHKITSSF